MRRSSVVSCAAGRVLSGLLLLTFLFPSPAAGSWFGFEHIPFGLDRKLVALMAPAKVDWKETPTSHEILIDVPGFKIEELKVEVEESKILRVSGERKMEEEEKTKKDEHWHRTERSDGKFWRQFRLPDNVDVDSVSANLQDGVLKVTLAKLAPELIKGPTVVRISAGAGGDKEKNRASARGTKNLEL